ncbi:MAG: permease-like cell division protein FtsX [Bacilli bacterium]|nr:permease-like cell division protein FtsX [Bacilli bacterium]MDD4644089.1 permease-like cell division protein FtsX [Bacilli bacterium]
MIMRLIRMIGRDIRDALKSVFRNFSLSMASISCITITLILVSLAIILSYNVNNITVIIKKDFTIVTFLDNKIDQEGINEIEYSIREHPNIAEYKFQSKADIAVSMMEADEIFKSIMQRWDEDENPLKDIFLIKVKDVEKITETAKEIEQLNNVSVVSYGEGIVEQFLSMFKIVEKALLGAVALFVVVTAFLINNTIKLTITARSREIEIMRLVGASNFNIQLPFIVEGLFLGVLGAIIPIILTIYGYNALYINFDGYFYSPFMRLVQPEPYIYILSLILLGIGILVGMFGSFRAVRKYLKI